MNTRQLPNPGTITLVPGVNIGRTHNSMKRKDEFDSLKKLDQHMKHFDYTVLQHRWGVIQNYNGSKGYSVELGLKMEIGMRYFLITCNSNQVDHSQIFKVLWYFMEHSKKICFSYTAKKYDKSLQRIRRNYKLRQFVNSTHIKKGSNVWERKSQG